MTHNSIVNQLPRLKSGKVKAFSTRGRGSMSRKRSVDIGETAMTYQPRWGMLWNRKPDALVCGKNGENKTIRWSVCYSAYTQKGSFGFAYFSDASELDQPTVHILLSFIETVYDIATPGSNMGPHTITQSCRHTPHPPTYTQSRHKVC